MSAIARLQTALGTTPDGVFGPQTATALWLASSTVRAGLSDLIAEVRAALGARPSVIVGGEYLPTPSPLWVIPYRFGELSSRPRALPVVQVVLHHDAAPSAEACWSILRGRGLSSHFAVRADGIVLQYLDPARRVAQHAAGQVRLGSGSVVPAGFNAQSIGIDINNPVTLTSKSRPYVQGLAQGRQYAGSGCHPCQVAATLALLRVLRGAFPGIAGDHWDELRWRGDVRPDTPGIWAHAQVNREKVDPWGFPLARLREV